MSIPLSEKLIRLHSSSSEDLFFELVALDHVFEMRHLEKILQVFLSFVYY